MKEASSSRSRKDKIVVFLIAFIPRLVFIFAFARLLRTPMDEMSTISTGAYFGGKDWTALTNYARFYYGGGFTILFAPFFRMIESVETVYYIILSACALLQSISAPISYQIMERYFNIKNRRYLLIGSVACSYMVVTRAMLMYNEHVIIGCVWIIALLLCRLVANRDNKRQRIVDSVLMMLVFSYMLTVHTRTNVIWIALPIVVVCYYIVYKRCLVAVVPTIITAAAGYFAAGQFNNMVKRVIWNWQPGEYLKNTSLDLHLSLSDLKNPIYWKGIFTTIFGQVNTMAVFTGGLAVIILVVLFYLYADVLKERFQLKKPLLEVSSDAEAGSRPFVLSVSVLFLLCVGAMTAAQSITWLADLVRVLQENTYGTNAYSYKAVTYIRYMGPFVGPLFMSGIAYIYHKKNELRKYLVPSCVALGCLHLVWLAFILPHISNNRAASEVFTAFSGYNMAYPQWKIGTSDYLMGTLVMAVVFVVCLIAYYKKKILAPLVLITVLFIYQYGYGAVVWDGDYAKSYYSKADAGIAAVQEAERAGYDLPDELYVYSTQKTVQKEAYTFQVYLYDYKILMGRPDPGVAEAIVFSNAEQDEELQKMGYRVGQLDDNEYVYVNTDKYLELFKAQGVVFPE